MRTDRTERIAAAVARELGVPELPDRLAALDASPLGSLLLAAFRARAGHATPAGLRAAYARTALHRPSSVDARLLHRADRAAYEVARAFEALELSPVAPLGACHALGGARVLPGPRVPDPARGPSGVAPVGDGGFTPWTQALLADRKERFLASAIGTEILCNVYGPGAPDGPRASVANPPRPS